ncbi:MAG: DUF3073 domain-containing protein [Candidatus Nanopelagicales bacterium]
MGRGRAKAKQTKVARELKYSSGNTDLSALQAELTGGGHERPAPAAVVEPDEDDDDLYAKYIDDEDDD